jgi:hypothetical protein
MPYRYSELIAAREADDTAVIEEAVREMLRSGDMRFVDPRAALLAAQDPEGAHVADHVLLVIDEHTILSPVAAEVLRIDSQRTESESRQGSDPP